MKSELELLDRHAVCAFFGGTRPLNPATVYRKIRVGVIPKPIKVGSSSRWLLSECRDALAKMTDARR
jgi:predicted DNA-binding transcriptional regulator AlpA